MPELTELTTEQGMHIEANPETGAIANPATPEDLGIEKDTAPAKEKKTTEDAPAERVDPRKALMDKIYANRAKAFDKELEVAAAFGAAAAKSAAEGSEEGPPETVSAPATEAVVKPPATEAAPAAIEPASAPPAVERKRVIIGGQAFDLTDQELAAMAARATQIEQQRQQQYAPQQRTAPAAPVQQQAASTQEQQDALERQRLEQIKKIYRTITFGNEEEGSEALAELVNMAVGSARPAQAAGPTPDAIAQYAAQMAISQFHFEKNLDTIAREYADIWSSRPMSLVATDYVGNLRQKYAMMGVQKPDLDLYREACNLTREAFAPKGSETSKDSVEEPVVTTVTAMPSRVERKRVAPQPPAAVGRAQAVAGQKRAPTGSEIVEAMRRSRGQVAMS